MATQIKTAEATEHASELVSPDPIFRLASGFMAAKHLFAASELGLFEALADSPTTIDGLAARTGLTRRAARISADAMVALGLLERDGDTLPQRPVAVFLSGAARRTYARCCGSGTGSAIRHGASSPRRSLAGRPKEMFELDDELQEVMAAGIEAHQRRSGNRPDEGLRLLHSPAPARHWRRHRLMVDRVAEEHHELEAAVLEIPTVAEVARTKIAEAGLGSRIRVISGDAMSGPASLWLRRVAAGQPRSLLVARRESRAAAAGP